MVVVLSKQLSRFVAQPATAEPKQGDDFSMTYTSVHPAILVIGNRQKKLINADAVNKYLKGGARLHGHEKAHCSDGRYSLLNPEGRCERCKNGRCRTVRLSKLYVAPLHTLYRIHSSSAITSRDIQRNLENERSAREKIAWYNTLEDGRPARLSPDARWIRLPRLVYTPDGLKVQLHYSARDKSDQLLPKGGAVRIALKPQTPERLKDAKDYLKWSKDVLMLILRRWVPPREMLDTETQELKRELVEADFIRIAAELQKNDSFDLQPPKRIDKIWPEIVIEFAPGSHSEILNDTKASHLSTDIVQIVLDAYISQLN
jgi:hypothetical protein